MFALRVAPSAGPRNARNARDRRERRGDGPDARDGRRSLTQMPLPPGRGATGGCSSHTPSSRSAANPLVAHCITGALRTLPEPRVFSSIREKLLDSFSGRYKVFFVVGFDCRLGTHDYMNASANDWRARCYKDYTMSDVDRALAYIGAESFEVLPNRSPPTVDCKASQSVDRHPSYWLQVSKTKRCFEAVERYEVESGVCFDWVVRSRPDDLWKAPTPAATSLPNNVVTTGQVWPWFTPLQHWHKTNFTAMEDHFMAVPRNLADRALKLAPRTWWDCRPARRYAALCPPAMFHYLQGTNITKRPTMTSECLLGLHLREHGVRWQTNGAFQYIMRRVPGGPSSEPYSRMMASYDRGSATFKSRPTAQRAKYEQLERDVEQQRWGASLASATVT